ncbi:MAG: hypothetical protein A2W93_04940 [Bacteroidetes bacterium GWF2_43_63]|nr:MAG: hypothetical protein A2W94_12210 [Bacteroidetes bacterium GWE2_42_42]OFY56225.1 MAG: hypothetical protein A2W93_04940 [Bacteroidetes bacterium GWF2_43_63]HBG71897.1 hypothetical protein [Bacteroidales bacterium]HCB61798.1 hypothetical protein [Bacteroidales bacterium]HCY23820.1 hypothetical protein [Bacteroidales bacterium]
MDAYKLIMTSKIAVSKFLVVPTFHRPPCFPSSGSGQASAQHMAGGHGTVETTSKNNGSMTRSSFVASGRWNVVFAPCVFKTHRRSLCVDEIDLSASAQQQPRNAERSLRNALRLRKVNR